MSIERISRLPDGREFAGGASLFDNSADGRFAVIGGEVPGEGGVQSGIFVFDAAGGSVERVVVPGLEGRAFGFSISDDGDLLTGATDEALLPEDAGESDVYVFDRSTGALTLASDGSVSPVLPELSGDGSTVVYSTATRVASGVERGVEIVDLASGAKIEVSLGDNVSFEVDGVSTDGSRVVLTAFGAFGASPAEEALEGVYVFERADGSLERLPGTEGGVLGFSSTTASADGSVVVVEVEADSFSFLYDLDAGTREILLDTSSLDRAPSPDGRYVAVSTSEALLPADVNNTYDVYLIDREEGETHLVSLDHDGEQFDPGFLFDVGIGAPGPGEAPVVYFEAQGDILGDEGFDGEGFASTDVYRVDTDVIAVADVAATTSGAPVTIDAAANDVDLGVGGAEVTAVTGAANGTAVVADGKLVYTPDAGFEGVERLTYTVTDDGGASDEGAITVLVDGGVAALVVETAEDGFADDGLLSFREAVAIANARDGLDTIAFADSLAGGTVSLGTERLDVTDDLTIEGGGVTLRAELPDSVENPVALSVDGAALRLEDLSLKGGAPLRGVDASIETEQATLRGGVTVNGGSFEAFETRVFGSFEVLGSAEASFERGTLYNAPVTVEGELRFQDSTLDDASIATSGRVELVNSTVTGSLRPADGSEGGSVLNAMAGSEILLRNATVVGQGSSNQAVRPLLEVEDGAVVRLENSVLVANARGETSLVGGGFASNGRNLFVGDERPEGAAPGDLFADDPREVFADFVEFDVDSVALTLRDNGGPTETFALLNSPGNPAIDAADPDVAPPLDQRGFERVGPPDIGAVEATGLPEGELPPFPDLVERVPVITSRINGVAPELLRGDGETPFTITFEGGIAQFSNSVGYYVVGPDGVIGEAGFLFPKVETYGNPDFATPPVGASVETPVLEEDETLGLFVLSNGALYNDPDDLAGEGFAFLNKFGKPADVERTYRPDLFFPDGKEVRNPVLHATDFDPSDEGNILNPRSFDRALSGFDDGPGFLVAFEDKAWDLFEDFNDVILRVEGPNFDGDALGV